LAIDKKLSFFAGMLSLDVSSWSNAAAINLDRNRARQIIHLAEENSSSSVEDWEYRGDAIDDRNYAYEVENDVFGDNSPVNRA